MKSIIEWINNLKIRKKVILALIISFIIPTIVLGIYCYNQTKSILINQTENNIQNSLREITNTVNYKVQMYNNLATYIFFDKDILKLLNHDYTNYYDMYTTYKYINESPSGIFKYLHEDVKEIIFYTESNLLKHGNMFMPLSKVEDTSWAKQTLKDYNIHWFTDGQSKIFLTQQLYWDSDNAKLNLVYIEFDFNSFFSSFKNFVDSEYCIFITDNQKNILYKQSNFSSEIQFDNKLIDEIINNTVDKSNILVVQKKIEACNWNIYFFKPTIFITQSANQIALTVLIVIAICIIILLPFSRALSYLLVNRIEKLNDNMKYIQTKDLKVLVKSNSKDEIGELIRTFETMINKINTLIKEVYQSKIAQKEFELQALQSQINPHFLYNTLSLINWKAIEIGEPDISKVAKLLSTFYRTTLNKGKNLISVEDEIKNVTSYIEIQLIMHSYNFDINYEFDSNIKSYHMINLLLQPLVENSISHGIDYKKNGKGHLSISGKLVDNKIVFAVKDNGIGISRNVLPTILETESKGYGLRNVNERIKLFYGKEFGLNIESEINQGTTVTVTIPPLK